MNCGKYISKILCRKGGVTRHCITCFSLDNASYKRYKSTDYISAATSFVWFQELTNDYIQHI